MLIDYIINHTLVIDRSTYITVILGQITLYSILLTFYQFVVSFEGTPGSSLKYLGVSLTEYYIRNKRSMFHRIVEKPYFYILFLLQILYKPILAIYSNYFSTILISICSFLWYSFAVLYFIIFIILFRQCIKSLFALKIIFDLQTNSAFIKDLNQKFIQKSIITRMRNSAIDLLTWDIKFLIRMLKTDTDQIFCSQYHQLIISVFESYLNNKRKEIERIKKTNRTPKNQIAWIYASEAECNLLENLLQETAIIDEKFKKDLCTLHLEFVKLFLQRAFAENKESLDLIFNKGPSLTLDKNSHSLNCSSWEKLTISFFKNLDLESRKLLMKILHETYHNDTTMFQKYCEYCIFDLISSGISEVFDEDKQQKDFCKVFDDLLEDKKFNDYYAVKLCDNLISYQQQDTRKMIELLNSDNCTYLFCYIVIYYSIYKFRFDWKYLNIDTLKALWSEHTEIDKIADYLIQKFKQSTIEHRFSKDIFYKFDEYLKDSLTDTLLRTIYQEKMLDMFYITIVKLCVLEQTYGYDSNQSVNDAQIYFINQLANHPELMKYDNIKKLVNNLQYKYFSTLDYIPENLNISLKHLLR